MGKFKMSQSVIFCALFVFALIRCGSSCSSTPRHVCPVPTIKLVSEHAPAVSGGKANQANRDDPIPYQLSIRMLASSSGSCEWIHKCGAVILDEKTAVTAAHCFDESRDVSRFSVHAGENRLDVPEEENEQVLEVKKIIIHPKYNHAFNGSDIAILHVDKFQLNRYARAALVSPNPTARLSNMTAVISGWGLVSDGAPPPNILHEGNVTIESPENCRHRLENKMNVPVREGIVCAHDPVTRICTGDSGGPLVIQNYNVGNSTGNLLVGITSFAAKNCSRPNSAGVFTEISYFYNWIQENRDPPFPKSCSLAMEALPSPRSQKQTIYPHGNRTSLQVLCDFETDGGGWTIIQKRTRGPKEQFSRNWDDYKNGFGSLNRNFWLGLENIRALTKNEDQELRIELEDFEGEKKYAKYSRFSISDASDFYRLTLAGFSGGSTLNDSFAEYHNGQRFTTIDKDNDNSNGNCVVEWGGGGGWWFSNCGASTLNGLYFEKGQTVPFARGILWHSWKGWEYSLAKTEMKIRKRKS